MANCVILPTHFRANGDTTELMFKVIHLTPEYAKQQLDMGVMNGWGDIFESLSQYLNEIP